MNYGKNTSGLSDKALTAECFYESKQGTATYEGSMLAQGLRQDIVDDELAEKFARCGLRGLYAVHIVFNRNNPASALAEQQDLLVDRIGMRYVPGPGWQQGEYGGYQLLIGGNTLVFLSRLGTLKKIYHLIGS